jgi:hypothetical protein
MGQDEMSFPWEIARLEEKGPNEGRAKQIRLLRRHLENL